MPPLLSSETLSSLSKAFTALILLENGVYWGKTIPPLGMSITESRIEMIRNLFSILPIRNEKNLINAIHLR